MKIKKENHSIYNKSKSCIFALEKNIMKQLEKLYRVR